MSPPAAFVPQMIAVLVIIYARITGTGGSNAGTTFLIYAGVGRRYPMPELGMFNVAVSTVDLRGSLVTYSCPLRRDLFVTTNKYVSYGSSDVVSFSDRLGNTASGIYNTSVLITATLPVTVIVNAQNNRLNQDLFMALPVESLGNKYIVSNYDDHGYLLVIAAHEGKTSVNIHYKGAHAISGANRQCHIDMENLMEAGQVYNFTLIQYQVLFIMCHHMTGSYIYANQSVAVFYGNYNVGVVGPEIRGEEEATTHGYLQEQGMPLSSCGMRFVVPGARKPEMEPPFLQVIACYNNVKVSYERIERLLPKAGDFFEVDTSGSWSYAECTVGCRVTFFIPSEARDTYRGPSMVQLVPVSQFESIYTFFPLGTPYDKTYTRYTAIAITKPGTIGDICHDDLCGNETKWIRQDVRDKDFPWEVWALEMKSQRTRVIYHLDESVTFGLYMYRTGSPSATISALGIRFSVPACWTTFTQVDDKIDNDCDGNIDEELENREDDDFDGLIDEDLGSKPPTLRHGKWSSWSSWDCGIKCGGHAIFRRFRLCNMPPPIGEGRPCPGSDTEDSNRICDLSQTPCPEDCPQKKWGFRCNQECPKSCVDEKCDPITGHCISCRAGKTGRYCSYDCPRLTFGHNCSQSCKDYCHFSDCDPVYGRCEIGLSLTPFVLVCLGLSFIPAILVCATVYWCRNNNQERVELRHTIQNLDDKIVKVKLIMQARSMENNDLRQRSRVTGTTSNTVTATESMGETEISKEIRASSV